MKILKLENDGSFKNLEMSSSEALSLVINHLTTNSGWVMLDGNLTQLEAISEESLDKASSIVLTNLITGGHEICKI